MARRRLDLEMVRRGLSDSREMAQLLIKSGKVLVSGSSAFGTARLQLLAKNVDNNGTFARIAPDTIPESFAAAAVPTFSYSSQVLGTSKPSLSIKGL